MALTSGQVADQAGVNKETLRYYERRELIDEPPRDSSNYRQYPVEVVDRIKFIKRAQELGFSLQEIETLLEMTDGELDDQEEILDFAEQKLEDIRRKLEEYRKLEALFSELIEDCRSGDSIHSCPLIEALTGEQSLETNHRENDGEHE